MTATDDKNRDISFWLLECSDPVLLCGEDGSVLWCNESARRAFRISAEDPRRFSEILPDSRIKEVFAAGRPTDVLPVQLKTLSGAEISQTAVSALIDSKEPGMNARFLIFKSCSAPGEQAIEREDLAASVAHDLKNPLAAIFGYSDTLLDTAIGVNLTKRQKQVLAKIRSTAARSIEMVRNCELLFQLGLPQTGQPDRLLDFNEIVRHVLEYTWRDDPASPVLHLKLHPEPLLIKAERLQLDRIVGNLFTNAIKYTPPGGRVTIETYAKRPKAVFVVSNTGPAIAAKDLPNLFNRYYRGAGTGGRSGSGLGLYICKRLADALRGAISVQSEEGKGTVFKVELPLAV